MKHPPKSTPLLSMTRLMVLVHARYAGWREDYLGLEQLSLTAEEQVALAQQALIEKGLSVESGYSMNGARGALSDLAQWSWQCVSLTGARWNPLVQSYEAFVQEHVMVTPYLEKARDGFCAEFIDSCTLL